jgi:hypothetical protein
MLATPNLDGVNRYDFETTPIILLFPSVVESAAPVK